MENLNFLDVLVVLFGIYCMGAAIRMKRTGRLPAGLMSGSDNQEGQIADPEGFCRYMFGRILLLGLISCIIGAAGIVVQNTPVPVWVDLILVGIYFLTLIGYAVQYNKAKDRFGKK